MPETIRTDISPRGVATVTLDRPHSYNAFNQQMLHEFAETLAALATDHRVRVVVIRGAGKHFSAGADVTPPKEPQADVKHTGFIELFLALDDFPKPTIAIVHGACAGGSAALVACCDLVLATETAFFSIPEVRIGVAPVGVTPTLIRAMGYRAYRRYAMSGERIPARDAHRCGLADEVTPETDLEDRLAACVDAFMHGAPSAQAQVKAHLRDAYPAIREEMARAHDHHVVNDTFRSPEAREGIAALMEKRKPAWYQPE